MRSDKMITFGLTGSIGTGKSNITKTFVANHIPMIDADKIARQVVQIGSIGLSQIVSAFSQDILLADGNLDRVKLGSIVFPDPTKLNILNQIMLPLIQQEGDKQISQLHQTNKIIGWDAALLIETGRANQFHPLIVVSCPTSTQISRLEKRGLTTDGAMIRINAQLPTSEKIKHADFVIDTSGSFEETRLQTLKIIDQLRRLV